MRSVKAIGILLMLLVSMATQWLHYSYAHAGREPGGDRHAAVSGKCFYCEHLACQPVAAAGPGCFQLAVDKSWKTIRFAEGSADIVSSLGFAYVNKGPPDIDNA